jgi:formylmethanofuran dehydrogenase subunit B
MRALRGARFFEFGRCSSDRDNRPGREQWGFMEFFPRSEEDALDGHAEPKGRADVTSSLVFDDVACAGCGCVCDDLRVTVAENRIVHAENACSLAETWLAHQQGGRAVAQIAGREVSLQTALDEAASWLQAARNPLIYGLSRSSTDGQREAVRLADRLGATIDTTASRCHAPSIMAIQEVGESTCSLGEVKNRCDLVIFWGADPQVSHPRHAERYSVFPPGMFLPRGRQDRTVVVVADAPNASCELADQFIPIQEGQDFEAIWTLRCLIRDWEPPSQSQWGGDPGELRALAQLMRGCRSGVVFFGLGLARNAGGHRNVEALLRLVTDLNAETRFYAKRMRIPGDVTGADSVLCWQTGFPFSVNLARGYPRYNPGEYSANELLEREEVDLCLLVGSEGTVDFSPTARDYLATIPTIALDYPAAVAEPIPGIQFTTAVHGIHRPGTAYRMDEVPIPLRPILTSDYPSDAEVLRGIRQALSPTWEDDPVGIAKVTSTPPR